MENSKKISETYVKEIIYNYLENAPTLFGLPVDFLPTDIIPMNVSGYIRLDFTISESIETFVNRVYSGINKPKLNKIFKEFTGKDLEVEINSLIQESYYKHFYTKIHLSTKTTCSTFLKGLFEKFTKEFSTTDKEAIYQEFKVDDSFYERGLIDYDYTLIGLDISLKDFKSRLIQNVRKTVKDYIEANEIYLNNDKKELQEQVSRNVLEQRLVKDVVNMNKVVALRFASIYKRLDYIYKNHAFLKESSKEYVVEKTTGHNLKVPVFTYPIESKDPSKLILTPVSAYYLITKNDKTKIFEVYNLNKQDQGLEESKEYLIKCIKQLGVVKETMIHSELLSIKDINTVINTMNKK